MIVHNLRTKFDRMRFPAYSWLVLMAGIALVGMAAEFYFTRHGVGTSGDGVHYMEGARNLLLGKGYSRLKGDGTFYPLTGFPPLFSISLAGLGLLGMEAFDAARLLNVFLFGINAALVGVLIFRAVRSSWLALGGSLLFLLARNMLLIHGWVMSEPLYLCLAFLAILTLSWYFENGRRSLLLLSALLIGAASLTRYVGLALIPAACIAIVVLSRERWTKRWVDATLAALVSLVPVAAWFVRNALVTANLTNRALGYHPISQELVFAMLDEVAFWWFPGSMSFSQGVRWVLLGSFVVFGFVVYGYSLRSSRAHIGQSRPAAESLPGIIGLYGFFYAVILYVNTTFLDAATDLPGAQRYVIPLLAVGMVWSGSTFSQAAKGGWGEWALKGSLLLICAALVQNYASVTIPFLKEPGAAFGYTSAKQAWSCEMEAFRNIGTTRTFVTNDYEFFYFLAGHPAYTLPKPFDHYQLKTVDDFSSKMEDIKTLLKLGAVLAVFGSPDEDPPEVTALLEDASLWVPCSNIRFYLANADHP